MPGPIPMAVKPVAYPDPGASGASLDQSGSSGFFEPLVRSLAGDGADIALVHGRVCIRKRIRSYRMGARRWGNRPVPAREWAQRSFWVSLGLFMYSEAAALLRLSDLPFVPKLRGIDLAGRTPTSITFGAKTSGASRRAVAPPSTTPTSRTTLTCAACRRAISNAERSSSSTGPGSATSGARSPRWPAR